MAGDRVLEVERLTRSYRTGAEELTVLRDVTFALSAGETLALVGPSGSGKSTLLALCAGLDRPTSGKVVLLGEDLAVLDEDGRAALRAHGVGFVFQSFRLMPTLTAFENVLVPLELRGDAAGAGAARAMLHQVGLGNRLRHYPAELSGGEQQRVALARAFVHRPRVLFADEPTGNLDRQTSHGVVELLFGLNRDHGTTLVLVTHDLELADRAGRVLQLRDGRVLADESQDVVQTPRAAGGSA